MVSVLVVANAGGGSPLPCGVGVGLEDNIVLLSKQINKSGTMHYKNEKRLYKIEKRVIGLSESQHQLFEDA
jgi:hypothetical protein